MTEERQGNTPKSTRREFLKTTTMAAAGTALAANLSLVANVHAAGSDLIKVGLIGCGGRGSGAAEDVLKAAPNVQVVALGDVFKFRVHGCRQRLLSLVEEDETVKKLGNTVDLPEDHCFVGLDAYERVLDSGINYVILATPPGFRPPHLQAAVAAGKHIFTEKPVGVDGPGIRKVLEAYEEAKKKNLAVAAGTQRRHDLGYIETIKRLHDGDIGDIVAARCYWNEGHHIWFRARQQLADKGEKTTDLAYQLHNWYHFVWVCGDHIVEQHVHNLDVINWAMRHHPLRALGMGGRVLPCADPNVDGHIYNFFAIDYEYPNGVHVLSMCRQVDKCDGNFPGLKGVSEALVGTKGNCQVNAYTINGRRVVSRQRDKAANPYVQEHTDLIESIRSGKPINELKNVAESTLTAILGRMSAYTGKALAWEQALNSEQDLMPKKLDWDMHLTVPPVAVPGKTPLV